MSILWNKCQNQVALLLGQIDGVDVATAATNYAATQSTSTLRGADFPPLAIQDACIESVMQIAHAICESPAHPEINSFIVTSSATASGAAVPTSSSGSVPRIGPIRRVIDSTNSRTLREASVDQLRDYLSANSTVFVNYTPYLYAIDGGDILHTRTNVLIDFCGFTRATITANVGGTDVIPLNDEWERAVVAGAVAKLAPRETMYMALAQTCEREFFGHLASIRSYPKMAADEQK